MARESGTPSGSIARLRTYVRNPPPTEGALRSREEILKVMALVKAGRSDREIEQRTGIPRRTISDWRRGRHQILPRSRKDHGCAQEHDFSALPPEQYSYLLGLYLGDGCITRGNRGVWCMRVTLDSSYPGIIEECCAPLEAVLPGKRARRGPRRGSRCTDVSMWSKHWPCFFPQHGPGRKHLRPISLEPWQDAIVAAFRRPFVKA